MKSSLIKKAGEIPARETLQLCIYGPVGTGKTTLACSAPRPLLIDIDGSAYRLNQSHQVDTLDASNYTDLLEVLNKYDLDGYDTIIFDTLGKLLESMGDYLRRNEPKFDEGGQVGLKGFGVIATWFRELCQHDALVGKNVIFIGHQDNTSRTDKPYYEPMCIGKNFARLATELDLVGHIEMYGDKRTITFNPSEMFAGKNTCNLPAKMDVPALTDETGQIIADNTFLTTDVIRPYVSRQIEMKAQRDAFNKVVDDFTKAIKKTKTPAEFNDVVASIDTIAHVGASRLKMASIVTAEANVRNYIKSNKTGKYGTATAK